MKHASLLIAFCVLFSFSAVAQSTAPVEKNTQRITITKKKVDDNGKAVTETWIAEGQEPEQILKEMALNPDVIQKVEIVNAPDHADGERLFLFRSAGDKVAIEGTLNETTDDNSTIVIIKQTDDGSLPTEVKKINTRYNHSPHSKAYAHVVVGDKKSNCAALGVWANNAGETTGARINGLIEKGGAIEAGMQEGDVIRKIDEFEVNDFTSLHLALAHFRPGDEVTVRYERGEKKRNAKVLLKDWAELPGHEWRSKSDCGKSEPAITEIPVEEDPNVIAGIQTLELTDATVYPNPTEGVVALSFKTNPGPLKVSITDINGKVVYSENNENASGLYKKEIDLTTFPQGNYVICVKQDGKLYTQQIAKQ